MIFIENCCYKKWNKIAKIVYSKCSLYNKRTEIKENKIMVAARWHIRQSDHLLLGSIHFPMEDNSLKLFVCDRAHNE